MNKKLKLGLLLSCSALLATCGQPPSLLDEIMSLGELRVITQNSPTTFYRGAHGPEGPEYDLIRGFAKSLGVKLRLLTTDRRSDLLSAIESGRAHIAAAGLTVTPDRERRVTFGPAYQHVQQYVIYKLGSGRPDNANDLTGKRLEIAAGNSYTESLQAARSMNPDLIWTEDPHADVPELLTKVAQQQIDYTVVDSTLFRIYRNYLPEIRIGFELASDRKIAWAMPKRNDRSLLDRVSLYMKKVQDNGMLARLEERYYRRTQQFDYVGTRRFMRDVDNKLPQYRELFKTAASEQQIDWRLLAAIGYQESHWDPAAVSPTGVRGIMMLTQNTAGAMGVNDRVDPAQSIDGGADYLTQVKARLPDSIREPDRTWFALAAYNVGFGHVADARRITERLGHDPNAWVDVKQSLPLLAQHNWYEHTRYGYARGWEPVLYVENIRNYYDILVWLTNESRYHEPDPIPTIADAPKRERDEMRPG